MVVGQSGKERPPDMCAAYTRAARRTRSRPECMWCRCRRRIHLESAFVTTSHVPSLLVQLDGHVVGLPSIRGVSFVELSLPTHGSFREMSRFGRPSEATCVSHRRKLSGLQSLRPSARYGLWPHASKSRRLHIRMFPKSEEAPPAEAVIKEPTTRAVRLHVRNRAPILLPLSSGRGNSSARTASLFACCGT